MAHSKYLKLCGPNGLFCNFSTLRGEGESSWKYYANECVWLCSNKTLLALKFEFHVISTYHETLFFFLVFFSALKHVKTIVGVEVIQKSAVGCSWLTPALKLRLTSTEEITAQG